MDALAAWMEADASAPALVKDTLVILALAAAFPAARAALDAAVFKPLAARALPLPRTKPAGAAGRAALPDKHAKKLGKFAESGWKLSVYSFFTLGLALALCNERWLFDSTYMWRGLPSSQRLKVSVKAMYLVELSFYTYCVPALFIWETKRKDRNLMLTHHLVTITLIGMSYVLGYSRVGTAIMLLHDVCDIFLEGAKMFKYSGSELGANLLFALFTLSWLLLRLGYYPFFCIYSVLFVATDVIGRPPDFHNVFIFCLCALQVMHVFWFYMIVNMIVKALSAGGVQEDYRSDDDEDD